MQDNVVFSPIQSRRSSESEPAAPGRPMMERTRLRSASVPPPGPAVWTGRVLSALFALFMLGASATPKLLRLPLVEAGMAELGWPPGYGFMLGWLELSCVVLYLIPRTSVLGAVLTMGLLGGAIATHIGAQSPLFSHQLFPIYVGLVMWGGIWLRNPQLRALFPIVRRTDGLLIDQHRS